MESEAVIRLRLTRMTAVGRFRASMARPGFLGCEETALPTANGDLAPVDVFPDPHRGRKGAILNHIFDRSG